VSRPRLLAGLTDTQMLACNAHRNDPELGHVCFT